MIAKEENPSAFEVTLGCGENCFMELFKNDADVKQQRFHELLACCSLEKHAALVD